MFSMRSSIKSDRAKTLGTTNKKCEINMATYLQFDKILIVTLTRVNENSHLRMRACKTCMYHRLC